METPLAQRFFRRDRKRAPATLEIRAARGERLAPATVRRRADGSDPAATCATNSLLAVRIRPATDADWPSIYPIWRDVVAAGETYAYPPGLSPDDARPWWMEQAPGLTVVAEPDGAGRVELLGSAKMGPNRPGRGSHVATASFMVAPDHRGEGVGAALGHYVLDWARSAGYRAIQFNAVVETNTPAVHLWTSLGFEILATVPEAFDHPAKGLVGLHVMYRRL